NDSRPKRAPSLTRRVGPINPTRKRGETPILSSKNFHMADSSVACTAIARQYRHESLARMLRWLALLAIIVPCLWYGDFFEWSRYRKGIPHVFRILVAEGLPPDFSRYAEWSKALVDTIVMSIAGTAIAVAFSFVLAFLAASNTAPHWLVYVLARGLLN